MKPLTQPNVIVLMGDFFKGAGYLFRAMPLILKTPELRRRAWYPLITNIIVVATGVPICVYFAVKWTGGLISDKHWWELTARFLVQLLVLGLSSMVAFLLMTVIAGAITGPQNTRLSRQTEQILLERRGQVFVNNALPFIRDAFQNIILTLARMALFLIVYLPILALQLIPVAGQILFLLSSIIYGAFVLSLDFGDYTFERHFTRYRDKVRHVLAHKWLYLGYGTASFLMMMIPFLNLVLLPLCVVGGTLLFVEGQNTGSETAK